jgi:serine/threonine protein kinase
VHHLHFHKKSHNHLNTKTILYNNHGNLFINMLTSTTAYNNKAELIVGKALHWHSPESLSPKATRSCTNDIWALGCLAIQMLTKIEPNKSSLHPYNFSNFKHEREVTMIDNLKQRYPNSFKY